MILPIVAYGHPTLKAIAQPITPDYPELDKLLADMWETLAHSEGVGLAAPQVNKSIRLFIVDGNPFYPDYPAAKDFKQAFINAVRQTGGNNASRVLIVQAPSTSVDLATNYDVMPQDNVPNAMMLEVHFYAPYNFTMMTKDESWGNQAYYWGSGNHFSGSKHNVTWGEEAYMQTQMRQMRTKYTSKGIPVIMGEFGTLWRTMPKGESQEKHDASIYSWYYTLCRYAVYNGVVPFVWDTNNCQRPSMDVLNRKTLTVFNQKALDGIIDGCASVKWPVSSITPCLPPSTGGGWGEAWGDESYVYDLQGRLLTSIPDSGLFIMNGKKYIR